MKSPIVSDVIKEQTWTQEDFGIEWIKMNKNTNTLVIEVGGYENLTFGQTELRSYIRKVKHLTLGEGYANVLQQYFCKMQKKNERFYYVMDISEESRLTNVFCTDAWRKAAYKEFDDVISFNSIYLTNKYDIPFTPT